MSQRYICGIPVSEADFIEYLKRAPALRLMLNYGVDEYGDRKSVRLWRIGVSTTAWFWGGRLFGWLSSAATSD